MIEKHLKNGFLFPPVITKQIIEDDMLSPFMKELNENIKVKQEASPVQTYHGTNLFLFTPLVKLYMDLGLKISNVKEVIQYFPGKCFLPFANRVVQLRSEATRDGDDAKQLTAKLFGNSGESMNKCTMVQMNICPECTLVHLSRCTKCTVVHLFIFKGMVSKLKMC